MTRCMGRRQVMGVVKLDCRREIWGSGMFRVMVASAWVDGSGMCGVMIVECVG